MLVIKKLGYYLITYSLAAIIYLPNALYILFQLYKNRQILSNYDNIISIGGLGFGNSIQGADISRRYLYNQKSLVLIMNWGFHNAYLSSVWHDIEFFNLETFFHFKALSQNRILINSSDICRSHLDKLIINFLKIVSKAKIYKVFDLYIKTLSLVNEGQEAVKFYRNLYPNGNAFIYLSWPILIRKNKVKKVEFVDKIKKEYYEKINDYLKNNGIPKDQKICCIYIRNKGVKSNNITNYARNGSELSAYSLALKSLINKGYIILLVGDLTLDNSIVKNFDNKIIDADALKINEQKFSLFALTEANIFIGNSGGGSQLPIVNEIPSLIIDAMPFGIGLTNSYMFFKTVKYNSGELVPFSKLLIDYPYDYRLKNLNLFNNNADEINYAVKYFLNEIHNNKPHDSKKENILSNT